MNKEFEEWAKENSLDPVKLDQANFWIRKAFEAAQPKWIPITGSYHDVMLTGEKDSLMYNDEIIKLLSVQFIGK